MSMTLRIEVYDTYRRRIARFDEVPCLDAARRGPDRFDEIRCVLPHVPGLGVGGVLAVYVNGCLWLRADIVRVATDWDGELQVEYHPVAPLRDYMTVLARTRPRRGNTRVIRAYADTPLAGALHDLVNRAPGPLHYYVDHEAYPDGAQREYDKFVARATPANCLGTGGIDTGQWVGADRMDLSGAWAKDGDTIAGIVVDGVAWPDLRLMMIDAEEMSLNNHARKRHPETALWSAERYARSGYKLRADRAGAWLQNALDTKGISHIELNPHRDASGAFDDRVDAYGRYLGLVFGGGECFNAALVELGHADIYLYDDGRYLAPELALKEYYSYTAPHRDSCDCGTSTLGALDFDCGALEAIAALVLIAGNRTFTISPELGLRIVPADLKGHALAYRADRMRVRTGFAGADLVNWLGVTGHPMTAPDRVAAGRGMSISAYGLHARTLDCEWAGDDGDKQRLAEGLVADTAYPATAATLVIPGGAPDFEPGDLLILDGVPLERYAIRLPEEWGDRFPAVVSGRVAALRHRMTGADIETEVVLCGPLRSVAAPLTFLGRIRAAGKTLFSFRLDEAMVGLDQEQFHLGKTEPTEGWE